MVGARAFPTEGVDRLFGPWTISRGEIFAESSLSFAFVNLKPVVSGHVLVAPKRVCKRFTELTGEEVADLWQLAKVSDPVDRLERCVLWNLAFAPQPTFPLR